MKLLLPSIGFFLASVLASADAPKSLPSLKFDHMALGNVARVLSARFSAPVTILAKATSPISGDFSGLDLKGALEAAAKQAGLAVTEDLSGTRKGYQLGLPEEKPSPSPAASPSAAADADRRRAELLQRRADLLAQAAALGHSGAAETR